MRFLVKGNIEILVNINIRFFCGIFFILVCDIDLYMF